MSLVTTPRRNTFLYYLYYLTLPRRHSIHSQNHEYLSHSRTHKVNQIESVDSSIGVNCEVNNFTGNTIKKLESIFLNAESATKRSQKFKKKLENCLSPYHEINKNLVRRSKQTKITAFLNKKKDTQNFTTEKNLESKDDIQPQKRSRLIILRSDKEENC